MPRAGLLSYGRSFVTGSAFAVGWTPCIGPILGSILTLAASSSTVVTGASLLLAWSLGLGLPFIVAGLALQTTMRTIRALRPFMGKLELLGGIIVVSVGILVFTDEFTIFNRYLTFGATAVASSEGVLAQDGVSGSSGIFIAFLAGVIAFLSPCSLPLVPAYLGHLAGVTATEKADATQQAAILRHSLAFVLGFAVVFVVLGASVGAIGYVLRDNLSVLQKIAGVLLIVMGLNLVGLIRIPWLYRTFEIRGPDLQKP